MNRIVRIIWLIFYLLILVIIIKVLGNIFGIQFEHKYSWFRILFLGLPVIILFVHSFITLSLPRSLFFIFLAMASGTFFEYVGLRDGTFFGGNYVYKLQSTLFNVPVSVILFWAVFIYTGYCLTNSFLYWLKIKKPNIKKNNIFLLLFTILLDGYFVTAIDLFMDPIAVKSSSWKWLESGEYFGVPIGNFIGWLIVTITVVGIFRIFEYCFPNKERTFNKSVMLIPVLSYGLLAVSFIFSSLNFNITNLAIIGSLFMIPQVIINLLLYIKWKQS